MPGNNHVSDSENVDAPQRFPALRSWKALVFLLLLTAGLRLLAMTGPFWVDEGPILRNVAWFVSERTVVPDHFSYPPLFSYLAIPATGITSMVGGLWTGMGMREWALLEAEFSGRQLVLGARLLSMGFALLTVFLLWRFQRRLSGTLAGFCVAVSPVAVWYGAWGLADVATGSMALLAVFLALEYAKSPAERRSRMLLLAAGAAVGVAAAFKYNGALAGLGVAVAVLLSPGDRLSKAVWLIAAGAVSIGVFLLLAPTWWLAPVQAFEGFRFESRNVATPRFGDSQGTPLSLLSGLVWNEPALLLALVLPVFAFASGKFSPRLLALWVTPLAATVLISFWGKQDANYFLPVMALAFAAGAEAVVTIKRREALILAGALLIGVAVVAFTIHRPLPPWSHDIVSADLAAPLIQEENRVVIRLGLHTPKVHTPESRDAYLANTSLSEAGRDQYERRFQSAAKADEVIVFLEEPEKALAALDRQDARILVISTQEFLDRYSRAPSSQDDPAQAAIIQQFLSAIDQWTPVGEQKQGGEPWTVLMLERP